METYKSLNQGCLVSRSNESKKFSEEPLVDSTTLIRKLMENCESLSSQRGKQYVQELKSALALLIHHEAEHVKAPTVIKKKVEKVVDDLAIHLNERKEE